MLKIRIVPDPKHKGRYRIVTDKSGPRGALGRLTVAEVTEILKKLGKDIKIVEDTRR